MAASVSFVELRERSGIGWVHPDVAGMGLAPFWATLSPLATAKGRGGVGTLVLGNQTLVVRPLRRGGALGAILRDRYTRPRRVRAELELLAALRDEGVPVVTPIAAVARRSGAFWRLRLCTELVDGGLPLPAYMAAHPEQRRAVAAGLGAVLHLAFAAGLRHPDLHVDNVLCQARGDRVRILLMDLDRAVLVRPLTEGQRDAMLVRLQRHLVRHRGQLASLPSACETMRCLRALLPDRATRHVKWRQLAELVARAIRRRRLLGR